MRTSTNSINRRNFLKISATAGTGLAVSLPALAADATPSAAPRIPVRPLGKTGLSLPILSMGVMRADNPNLLKAAFDAGVRHFDTANGYQNGQNETMLGNFFKDIPRDSFVIGTKVSLGRDLTSSSLISSFLSGFETSLKRLQMDYVDIFYVHGAPAAVASHPEVLTALTNLKKAGKIKWIGISTHSQEPAVINAMLDAKAWDVVLTSFNYKQTYLADLIPALERAHREGLGIVAMKATAGGEYLDRERTKPNNVKACLKWVWEHPFIHTAIPGFLNFEQLKSCVDAATHLEMDATEKQFLNPVASLVPNEMFCQQCGKCI